MYPSLAAQGTLLDQLVEGAKVLLLRETDI